MSQAEARRRGGNTAAVVTRFVGHEGEWITARELAKIAGFCAWRSRLAEARKILEAMGGSLTWNRKIRASAYRYTRHQALGPDAGQFRPQRRLF